MSTVVLALLIGDPAGRLDEVLARQVDTPEKFLRFLALLLGLTGQPFSGMAGAAGGSGRRRRASRQAALLGGAAAAAG